VSSLYIQPFYIPTAKGKTWSAVAVVLLSLQNSSSMPVLISMLVVSYYFSEMGMKSVTEEILLIFDFFFKCLDETTILS
jgi:hypothetical protein